MLVLTLHAARDPADRQRDSRTLDEGSLSIGRAPGNGWVLNDPAQHLSKTHCVVSSTPGGYVLTDCSSNGVFLNGARQRMPRDSQAPLRDGDEFALGEYLIQARLVAATAPVRAGAPIQGAPAAPHSTLDPDPFGLDEFLAPSPPPAAPFAAPPGLPPARAAAPHFDLFADPARSRRDDPFGDDAEDLLGSPAPAHRAFGDPVPRASTPAARDPFDIAGPRPSDGRSGAGAASRPANAPANSGRDAFGDDDDLFRGTTPGVEWQGPSQPDNVDAIAHAFVPPKSTPAPNMDEWDDLLGDTPPGAPFVAAPPAAPPPPAAAPAAAPVAVPVAVPVAAPVDVPPSASAPASPAPAPATADAAQLLAAFLEGAGVPGLDVSKQGPDDYFRAAGELFATMVESLRDVLMSRAAVKGEFGVEHTMLRPRDNNALKFSVTPADAVAALLQPGRPGYMAPLRATREAFDDVRIHQLAVMAGVQAALMNLLRTFDPVALEARLQKGGVVESILPATRRAKLWEAFCATYKDIARDADSDFQTVFGREFARAYTEQAKAK